MNEQARAEFEENARRMEAYQQEFAGYNRRKRKFFQAYFKYYHRLEVLGRENLPPGPALLAANHSGGLDLDIVALSYCCLPDRDIHVLIVESWHYLRSIWGRYYIGGGIPLWTQGGIRYEYIDPYLEPGGEHYPGLVAIYPEGNSGTFAERRLLHRFFSGVVRLAVHYQVPIVPVAQVGFHQACPILKELPRDHEPADPIAPLFAFPVKLKVEFGKPFTLENYYRRNLTRPEENWIANEVVRPKVAELLAHHRRVAMQEVKVEMKEPASVRGEG